MNAALNIEYPQKNLLDKSLITVVQEKILAWYAKEQRDLPWRRTHDPYHILVSEIMLQQTQVGRVLPKYHEFLTKFSTIQALAQASPAAVLDAWIPLGYNSRAIRLRAIACQIVDVYGGNVPTTATALQSLKGIGPYTAAAVACFAFKEQIPTVDVNIARVLGRIFWGIENTSSPTKDHWSLAQRLLPADQAYNWNQALMDIGATICSANTPKCEVCPVQSDCHAFASLRNYALFPTGHILNEVKRKRSHDKKGIEGTAFTEQHFRRKVTETETAYKSGLIEKDKQPFHTTTRYFRGHVIRFLRTTTLGKYIALGEILEYVHSLKGGENKDKQWLDEVLHTLANDDLIQYMNYAARLPI